MCTGGLDDRRCIDLGIHRITNVQPGLERGHLVDAVDRRRRDPDTESLQWPAMYCEVNQLLTAIRSPIASVKEHDSPTAGNRGREVNRVAVEICGLKRWERVAGTKLCRHDQKLADRQLGLLAYHEFMTVSRMQSAGSGEEVG